MAIVALASAISDDAMRAALYDVIRKWETVHPSRLTLLPDVVGTQWLYDNMPRDLAEHVAHHWGSNRWDSGGMIAEGERYVAFLKKHGVDPWEANKLGIPSDGLTVKMMQELDRHFQKSKTIRLLCGWGTNFTNGFKGCHPRGNEPAILWGTPIGLTWEQICGGQSMVIKLDEVRIGEHGIPIKAVKLSNNIDKATGDPEMVKRYVGVFGTDGRISEKPLV